MGDRRHQLGRRLGEAGLVTFVEWPEDVPAALEMEGDNALVVELGPDRRLVAELRDFIYFLKDLGLAPTTIRRQISAIRTYFKFLVGEGIAARDPSERIESPKRWRTLPAVLSTEEIARLLAAPNTDEPLAVRDRALLEFAYATGVRVSELIGIKLQDISFEDRVVRVFGKGSKERLVPFGKTALGVIAMYAREIRPTVDRGKGRGVLFLNARGTPLSREIHALRHHRSAVRFASSQVTLRPTGKGGEACV